MAARKPPKIDAPFVYAEHIAGLEARYGARYVACARGHCPSHYVWEPFDDTADIHDGLIFAGWHFKQSLGWVCASCRKLLKVKDKNAVKGEWYLATDEQKQAFLA